MSQNNLKSNAGLTQFSPILYDLQTRFLQVRALAESAATDKRSVREIQLLSKHALATLDYALFAIDMQQTELPFSTISASAAVQDVAQDLWQLSKTYGVDLEIDVTKRLDPIYANEAAVKGALFGLASTIIASKSPSEKTMRLVIAAQQTAPKTQRLGVYSPTDMIGTQALKQVRSLAASTARSAIPTDVHDSGLGLVLSDQLAKALGSELQRFTHRKQKGIGFYVPMSAQLSFI